MYDLVEFEKAGIPCVEIPTEAFESESQQRAIGQGLPTIASAAVPTEVSYLTELSEIHEIADAAMPEIIASLTAATEPMERRSAEPRIITIKPKDGEDILEAVNRYFFPPENRWSDGFPVIPPTEERVEWMLTGTERSPDEEITQLPPCYGKATVEKIAINAVMAGAKPEYLETIIAAVDAISDPKVYLEGTTTTTDPGNAPLIVINGPIVNELGLNYSWGVMGPGWRPNSTIGRALSLCVRNIGGADTPGSIVQHTYYLPHDYSMVLAQPYPETTGNWKLLSEQLGYRRDQNVVFVMPTDGPTNLSPFDSPTKPISAANLLKNWVDQMAQQQPRRGFVGLINFSPEHVRILAAEGWTETDVKYYIFHTAFSPAVLEAKETGYTTRGEKHRADTFGLTRMMKKPPVENCIVSGEDPVRDTFVLVSGAIPMGGHGNMIPRSSHGGYAAREIGTLAPPPARPEELVEIETLPVEETTTEIECLKYGHYWYGEACHEKPEDYEEEVPTPEEVPSEEEAPTPEETPEEEEEEHYESVC